MLVIGDELLDGWVTDANSPWLARRLREHGVPLERVHVVGDDAGAIDEALRAELRRQRPRVVFTSGGVGSTPDDITFEAVAASLGREVVTHPELADRMSVIADRTREAGVETDGTFMHHLMRMARVPDGARLLSDPAAWAPAIAIDVDGGTEDPSGATVVILPGVPAAFRELVDAAVAPAMLEGRNEPPTVAEVTHDLPESVLNAVFVEVMRQHPRVKLGSYPGQPMLVRLTGPSTEVAAAAERIRAGIDAVLATPGGERIAASWSGRSRVDGEGA